MRDRCSDCSRRHRERLARLFQLRAKVFVAHMACEIGRGVPGEDGGCAKFARNLLPKARVVDTAADRQIAEVRAREVTGVFEVENGLIVAGRGQDGAVK